LAVVQAVDSSLVTSDQVLLVACSGGADSLALAAAVSEVGRRRELATAGVVVDHGLQPGSGETADRARQQLLGLGFVDVAIVGVTVDQETGQGLEGAARAARYAALDAEGARREATVLLGHTQDDQAETVLLGLARGSGLRSLAGMAVRTGRYLRPMLSLPRSVSEQACLEVGLSPWRDPHNLDPAYARSRVRQRVLPLLERELGPGITPALARTAQLARADADLLDALASEAYPATDTIDCDRLSQLPAALRSRVIRSWLTASGAGATTYEHVRRVEELVTGWRGQRPLDLPGVQVSRRDGQLVCTPAAAGALWQAERRG
jgi:tRNA(Ile)-lysidine synthase